MILVRSGIKHDFDRNALNYLDIIAGCIFRREQTEARATRTGYAIDSSFVLAVVRIHFDRDALLRFHIAQLRFLEVGSDPDVVEIDDLH